jgi:hypothetical protein
MKTYSKIVGILLTIALLFGLVSSIGAMVVNDDMDEQIGFGLAVIPCLAFLYFMYLHKFGFDLKTSNTKYSKISLILVGVSLVILAVIPTWYLFQQITIEKQSEEMVDLGKNKASNGFIGSLKTKYSDGDIKYIVNLKKTGSNPFNRDTRLYITLKDKDGFKLETFELQGYTYEKDSLDNLEAITINSSHSMELAEYLKIKQWDLLYSLSEIPQ